MNKAIDIINAVKKLTQRERTDWVTITEYINKYNNGPLKRFVIDHNKYQYTSKNYPIIRECFSFCTELADGIVYLFSFEMNISGEKFFLLGTQQSHTSDLYMINDRDDLQEELTELCQAIDNSRNKNTNFLEKIIDMANNLDVSDTE